MKTFKTIVYWFLIVIALIQFIPVDRTNKPVDRKQNFTDIYQTPENIKTLLKNACYDCHSNETVYPDYAYIAPISWSVKHHVNEGREHLNFSEFGTFNRDLKKSMLENSAADLKQNRMPLPGYIVYHENARLSAAEKILLAEYFEGILKSEEY